MYIEREGGRAAREEGRMRERGRGRRDRGEGNEGERSTEGGGMKEREIESERRD